MSTLLSDLYASIPKLALDKPIPGVYVVFRATAEQLCAMIERVLLASGARVEETDVFNVVPFHPLSRQAVWIEEWRGKLVRLLVFYHASNGIRVLDGGGSCIFTLLHGERTDHLLRPWTKTYPTAQKLIEVCGCEILESLSNVQHSQLLARKHYQWLEVLKKGKK